MALAMTVLSAADYLKTYRGRCRTAWIVWGSYHDAEPEPEPEPAKRSSICDRQRLIVSGSDRPMAAGRDRIYREEKGRSVGAA